MKAANFRKAPTTLWVVHRALKDRQAQYTVRRVNIAVGIEGKLQHIIGNAIERSNQIEPYAYESSDQDERVLVRGISDTDFQDILPTVLQGINAPVIEQIEDLANAWATLIVADPFSDDPIIGFRRAPDAWNLSKLERFFNVYWSNHKLVDLEDKTILRLDQKVDFIGFRDQLFILSKKSFETGLNFRTGMERRRDHLLEQMKVTARFENVDVLSEKCGSNIHYLRKLCVIEELGYYKDDGFIAKLKAANTKEGWNLQFVDGKLAITEDTLRDVLTLLSNRRVQSMINEERFDVEGTVVPLAQKNSA